MISNDIIIKWQCYICNLSVIEADIFALNCSIYVNIKQSWIRSYTFWFVLLRNSAMFSLRIVLACVYAHLINGENCESTIILFCIWKGLLPDNFTLKWLVPVNW